MDDNTYKLLYQQINRQLSLEMKINKAKQDQIDSLSDALSSSEDQKEYLEAMLVEIRGMVADSGNSQAVMH